MIIRFFSIQPRLAFPICLVTVLLSVCVQVVSAGVQRPVQLANTYDASMDVGDFLVSEKYDGIRAIWKNNKLTTRNGHPIHAPAWFTKALPDVWLDGELWSKRQDFQFVSSAVSKYQAVDSEWHQITYMVFDAPGQHKPFYQRADYYTELVEKINVPHLQAVEQHQLQENAQLSAMLKRLTKQGAEGLILHRAQAYFQPGRSDNILKLKPYMDDEAEVIAYIEGKGKYQGMLGALKVRWQANDGLFHEFKIGTGFSDQERESPPPIGSTVTFKYHGLTGKGLPRFASFLRIRKSR